MKITVDRKYKKELYTISNLYVDGVWFCNVIEDTDRKLRQTDSLAHIQAVKVASRTAIPSGTYKVTLDVVSPKFSKKTYYKTFCNGKLPRLCNVPGFEGILIHKGNTEKDSAGCLIVGYNKVKGKVINSQEAFEKLYKKMQENKNNLTIEILE